MRSTQSVLDHHLACFAAGDLDGTLADFAEDSVLLTRDGALRGVSEIRTFFAAAFAEFGQPGTQVAMRQMLVDGDCAFLIWDADTVTNRYESACDTFVVRDGHIAIQTFAAKVTPKAAGDRLSGIDAHATA